MPVRIAQPENLIGMTDRLDSPAYSTSVGLLRWAILMSEVARRKVRGAAPALGRTAIELGGRQELVEAIAALGTGGVNGLG